MFCKREVTKTSGPNTAAKDLVQNLYLATLSASMEMLLQHELKKKTTTTTNKQIRSLKLRKCDLR